VVKDCPYNRLCARSIVTRRRGMGYKIPPWGKGLKEDLLIDTTFDPCYFRETVPLSLGMYLPTMVDFLYTYYVFHV